MKFEFLNGMKTYCPGSVTKFLDYVIDTKKILVAINAEKIMRSSGELKEILKSNIGYPDGVGAVWALRKKGHKKVVKIAGCELWLQIVSRFFLTKSFYLVGGEQDVIEATIKKLEKDFPGIQILNYRNGYIQDDTAEKKLIGDIKKNAPDIVFVAMGSPKQERLMASMGLEHPAIYQGLGGSFDVYTNKVKRAPRFWVKFNLEWAYRLWEQPLRIKRQIVYIPFMIKLLLNKI